MTKRGARQGCNAIQPLHLRHGAGAGRRGAGRVGAQARDTGGAGARHGARHIAQGRARGAAIRQPGAATRLGSPATTRRQCVPVRTWACWLGCV